MSDKGERSSARAYRRADPYANNDKAAAFVGYFASETMMAASVDRLYRGGMARKQQALVEAEEDAYPERFQPPARRSAAEIEKYLQHRVEAEVLRRQRNRVALQQELYPETQEQPKYLDKKQLDRQVKRLYSESMRQRKMRDAEVERVFGRDRSPRELGRRPVDAREEAEMRARETQWKPPSATIAHDDNRQNLCSQYEYYANPKEFTELYVVPRMNGRRMTAAEREHNLKRLTDLSRPVSVTPRRVEEEHSPNDPPPFRVHKRVEYV